MDLEIVGITTNRQLRLVVFLSKEENMKACKVLVRNAGSIENANENRNPQKRASRQTLVRQLDENKGLVRYHANKWSASARRCGISIEDLIAAGEWGLWYGTQKYDPDKGMSY